jgi:hypothetical protein
VGLVRIATWNMAADEVGGGRGFLASLCCEVLLLTEVPPDLQLTRYRLGFSKGVMVCGQVFAAVATRADPEGCVHPHLASVASELGGTTFMASVLPWRSAQATDGFDGGSQGERTHGAVDAIAQRWPSTPVVWGGDWNHELSGRISAGSKIGREAILGVVRGRGMQVPTVVLGSERGFGSVNHIAVPDDWKVMSVERHVASSGGRRLSDHDAYVVEIEDRPGPTTALSGRRESQPASLEAGE